MQVIFISGFHFLTTIPFRESEQERVEQRFQVYLLSSSQAANCGRRCSGSILNNLHSNSYFSHLHVAQALLGASWDLDYFSTIGDAS